MKIMATMLSILVVAQIVTLVALFVPGAGIDSIRNSDTIVFLTKYDTVFVFPTATLPESESYKDWEKNPNVQEQIKEASRNLSSTIEEDY